MVLLLMIMERHTHANTFMATQEERLRAGRTQISDIEAGRKILGKSFKKKKKTHPTSVRVSSGPAPHTLASTL